MADDGMTPETVSREAHERVTKERDDLKGQVTDVTGQLKDIRTEVDLFKHFSGKGIDNADALANRALPAFREIDPGELTAEADKWYEAERDLFGGTTPDPEEPESPPASPFQSVTPNPQASGEGTQQEKLLAGSPEFEAWAKGRSTAEINAAYERDDIIIPEAVRLAQQ